MADIICTNLVDLQLQTTYAEFKNSENEDYDQGAINFDLPTYNSTTEKYEVRNISGTDTDGETISSTTLSDDEDEMSASDRLNPTKVFWWVVKKAKGLLCPSCM